MPFVVASLMLLAACGGAEPEVLGGDGGLLADLRLDAHDEGAELSAAPPLTVVDFAVVDANRDSWLSVAELARSAEHRGVFDRWDADGDAAVSHREVRDVAYQLWDVDGNGVLGVEEWNRSHSTWFDGERAGTDIHGETGMGTIEREQFAQRFDVQALGAAWAEDPMDEGTFNRGYFELYDRDRDGAVSRGEWEAGVAAFGIVE